MQQRRFDEAESEFRNALGLAPDFAPLMEDLGSTLAQQRKFDDAILQFEQAIAHDEDTTMAPPHPA